MESTLALTFERENLMEEDGNVKLMLDSGRMYYKASYRIASHPPFLAGKKNKNGLWIPGNDRKCHCFSRP